MSETPYGKLVRKYRIVKGVTLHDMSMTLVQSSAYLSGIEHGRHPVTESMIDDVAKYFDLNETQKAELAKAAFGKAKPMSEAEIWLREAGASLEIKPITEEAVAVSRKYIELALEALKEKVETDRIVEMPSYLQKCKFPGCEKVTFVKDEYCIDHLSD